MKKDEPQYMAYRISALAAGAFVLDMQRGEHAREVDSAVNAILETIVELADALAEAVEIGQREGAAK